jgi:hypothetical protein
MSKKDDIARVTITLRVHPELHTHLEMQATLSHRSMNAEIITRLEKSLADDGVQPSPLLNEIYEKLSELDAILKAQDKNFHLAAEYIEEVREYIEDAGVSEGQPELPSDLDLNLHDRFDRLKAEKRSPELDLLGAQATPVKKRTK